MNQVIKSFFEEDTFTFSYVVSDPSSGLAAIIDPVMSFEPAAGRTSSDVLDKILAYIDEQELKVAWILETHAHADHMSGAPYLQEKTGAPIAIGEGIRKVQQHFKSFFNLKDFEPDGHQFDRLLAEGDEIEVGAIRLRAMATPGHTSDSMTYIAGDAAFVGDTLFMPDVGTARCDFPGGDAGVLYDSIQKILSLSDETRLHLCHDYPPNGRDVNYVCSVTEQRAGNLHVGGNTSREEFRELREARDATLDAPRLILPSLQVNIRAGHLPGAEDNGVVYLKIPVNQI